MVRIGVRLCVWAACVGVVGSALVGFATDRENPDRVGGLPRVDLYDRTPVTVDVFVRDRDGNPLTGLTRDQFRLLQDGVEVPISTFLAFTQEVFVPTTPDGEGPEDAAVPDRPASAADARPVYVVLYVDNQNLRSADRNRVLQSLRRFASDVLVGPVQIMVVSHHQAVEIVQPFTGDTRAVASALRSLTMTEAAGDRRDDEHARLQQEIRRATKSTSRTQGGRYQTLSDLDSKIRTFADEEDVLLERSLTAIRDVTGALTGLPGRKHLVYLSSGLPMVLAKDLLHELGGLDGRSGQLAVGTSYDKKRQYEALAATVSSQEVTVHTVDATGASSLKARIGDSDSPRSSSAALVARENNRAPLRLLADRTGGLAVVGSDDFGAALDRVKTDMLTYYSIGYTVDSAGSDTVHRVEVQLAIQDRHEIRYRRTFVAKSTEARVQEEATAGLFFDVDDNPLGLEVTTERPTRATETRWLQPVTVQLPVPSLAMTRAGADYEGRVVVFVATRELTGRGTDAQRRVHDFRLAADQYEASKEDRFTVPLRLLLVSGRHRIVVGVLDATTRQTSFVQVEAVTPDQL